MVLERNLRIARATDQNRSPVTIAPAVPSNIAIAPFYLKTVEIGAPYLGKGGPIGQAGQASLSTLSGLFGYLRRTVIAVGHGIRRRGMATDRGMEMNLFRTT
jgi:hypothetical protein